MHEKLAHNKALRTLHIFVAALFLFVQGQAVAMASTHAASSGGLYYCGNGNRPVEAIANIKYLLALQGETDESDTQDCELCFSFGITETGDSSLSVSRLLIATNCGTILDKGANHGLAFALVPVGLRAPPTLS